MRPSEDVAIIHGKWLTNLKRELAARDFCFICERMMRQGHDPACPMIPTAKLFGLRTLS